MQYLIRTIEHKGETFTDVTKIRDNESYIVVESESKEEVKREYIIPMRCPKCNSQDTDYQYVYVDNEPIFVHLLCNNCDGTYREYIEKDSE